MPAASQNTVGGTGQDTPSSEIDSAASSPCLRNDALQEELTALKHSVRSARVLPDVECGGPPDASTASKRASTASSIAPPPPPYSLAPAKARRRWREDFYDHFLDGAAGVMYTSFLGLILDDLIALGTGKYKKC